MCTDKSNKKQASQSNKVDNNTMKLCSACKKEIMENAIKCHHCQAYQDFRQYVGNVDLFSIIAILGTIATIWFGVAGLNDVSTKVSTLKTDISNKKETIKTLEFDIIKLKTAVSVMTGMLNESDNQQELNEIEKIRVKTQKIKQLIKQIKGDQK